VFRLIDPSLIETPEHGQFFMLTVPGTGNAAFTFITMPDQQGRFHALIRRTGSVTEALFNCKPGAIVGIRGPFGTGWPLAALENQRVLMIAGGCGLAPLTSLTDYLISRNEAEQPCLIYGAATTEKQMLNARRDSWRRQMTVIDIVESEKCGTATGTPLDALPACFNDSDKSPTTVLLCGPEKMMNVMAQACIAHGVKPSSIYLSVERRMHCAVGLCGHCYLKNAYVCKQGPTFRFDHYLSLCSPATEHTVKNH